MHLQDLITDQAVVDRGLNADAIESLALDNKLGSPVGAAVGWCHRCQRQEL